MHAFSEVEPQGRRNQAQPPHASPPAAPFLVDGDDGRTPRQARRSGLPLESPGRLVLANRQTVFVTLRDISRAGCCVVRKGSLQLQEGETVRIEIWRDDIQTKASLPATVRWVRLLEGTTRAGLRFLDSSTRTVRTINQYLNRSLGPQS